MSIEHTLAFIKPEAVAKRLTGEICAMIENASLRIIAAKMQRMTLQKACEFYAEHQQRPFYEALTEYISSGPIFVMALEGEDAVRRYRKLMGATHPKDSAVGTIRHRFARDATHTKVIQNAVHGSDSPDTARREIDFFFAPDEIHPLRGNMT